MSQTGANADEWIAARPGTEGVMALGFAHVMLKEKLRPYVEDNATRLIAGWSEGLPDCAPAQVEGKTGIPAKRIERLAREMAAHVPAVAMIGGLPLAHTNGLFSALAVNALNALLGSVGTPTGMYFTPRPPMEKSEDLTVDDDFVRNLLAGKLDGTKALLLYKANPVFATPAVWKVRDALAKIPFIVSFGSFIDETSGLADLILPDHSPLESWLNDVPESGMNRAVVSLVPPVMQPLHNTRAMPDVILEIAHQLGAQVGKALPWESFQDMLQESIAPLRMAAGMHPLPAPETFWAQVQKQGGWWSDEAKQSTRPAIPHGRAAVEFTEPQFDGEESSFPLHFQPYVSQALLDGSLAHLPWMQELPDALSTIMWGTGVEINPKTAQRLGIEQDDQVEVCSQHGRLVAPALLTPGIAFDVVAMPMGQGHESFGRYASGRGANPMTILAPLQVAEVGSLAWAATRVRVSKVGKAKLALFSGGLFEHPSELQHR
jgi:anaerobic selenocysteine-containing dehydrogenase